LKGGIKMTWKKVKRTTWELEDFEFGQLVIDAEGDISVVVAIQPDNGISGSVVCFMEDHLSPIVYGPEDLIPYTKETAHGL
jgi:hypothetical protein